MPKNKVSDPITDQEIAFARLVLSGAMTDRHAAEAVGLNPDSAAYTKSKPRVRAYMLEHRAAVKQELVQEEADLSRRAVEEPAVVLNQQPTPATTNDPQPSPARAQEEAQKEDSPGTPEPTVANRFSPSEAPPPYVPLFTSVPDLKVPFSIKKNPLNPFVRPR